MAIPLLFQLNYLLLRKLLRLTEITEHWKLSHVSYLLFLFDSSKSIGPYRIPTKLLKIARGIASLPLSQLINNSISKGIFPNICKLAQVISIFKNDSRLLCQNYRPILLLSNIRKIFEKAIHCRQNLFIEQNNKLYPFQFGFQFWLFNK